MPSLACALLPRLESQTARSQTRSAGLQPRCFGVVLGLAVGSIPVMSVVSDVSPAPSNLYGFALLLVHLLHQPLLSLRALF